MNKLSEEERLERKELLLWLVLCVSTIIGCDSHETYKKELNGESSANRIMEIVYRYKDASIPPEYHRSYTIQVNANRMHIVVDSYGAILAERTYDISEKRFNDLLESLKKNKIRHCIRMRVESGCTGGTTEKISLFNGENQLFTGRYTTAAGKITETYAET
jgi:hypothetical protein